MRSSYVQVIKLVQTKKMVVTQAGWGFTSRRGGEERAMWWLVECQNILHSEVTSVTDLHRSFHLCHGSEEQEG